MSYKIANSVAFRYTIYIYFDNNFLCDKSGHFCYLS